MEQTLLTVPFSYSKIGTTRCDLVVANVLILQENARPHRATLLLTLQEGVGEESGRSGFPFPAFLT
jgi:hypothetical protein